MCQTRREIPSDIDYIGLCESQPSSLTSVRQLMEATCRSNVPISILQTQAIGMHSKPSDTIVPYLAPHVQKGIPYHRYGLFVFKQEGPIDAKALEGKIDRDTFNLRSFQAKQKLEAIGATMWRNEFDEHTKDVMQRNNLPGWDFMWQRVKVE